MQDLCENPMIFSDEDDDDDVVYNVDVTLRIKKPYTIRPRTDIINNYDDDEFLQAFRFTKRTFYMILSIIEDKIKTRTDKNHAVSPSLQLLLTLRYYGTGMFQAAIGDLVGIHKSTTCKIIRKVTEAIASMLPIYIQFPTTNDEKRQTKVAFQQIAYFPRILGAIDCTHVKLQSPGGQYAEGYRNSKGVYSMKVQGICDSRMKFLDIVARWPGSSHNSTIFNASRICSRFLDKQMGNGLLLGENSYACSDIILTPFLQTSTRAQKLYNESHVRTRDVIEKAFDAWKRRFPALIYGLRVQPEYAQALIVATAVLSNIAIDAGEPEPAVDANFAAIREELEVKESINDFDREDTNVRKSLIDNYFSRLR